MRVPAMMVAGAVVAAMVLLGGQYSSPVLEATQAPPRALLNPSLQKQPAPATYKVRFRTSAGEFVVQVTRAWAPHGADRFYHLVRNGYYNGNRFFRAIAGFMVQWGMHGNPAVTRAWRDATLPIDPVRQSNRRGTITFAMGSSPSQRSTQVFINLVNNGYLDPMGFAPMGEVISGMAAVDRITTVYGEGEPFGRGPDQELVETQGNRYLQQFFPKLDAITTAVIVR
jgi:peptidyl-prolyl cis-trans isomerase A (cyclophilin A)